VAGEKLAPALNDVLIAHPSPGAVSRYSVHVGGGCVKPSADPQTEGAAEGGAGSAPPLWFHVRSSGLRACTSSGSTVGGPVHVDSP
jgi:NAD+ kinase